jgi:hypothetical protein
VIDPRDQNLYTVNLKDKKLYRFALNVSAQRRHARAAAAQPAGSVAIPNPACVAATATSSATNWRPFSAAFDRANDRLYVGGVCSAETTQDRGLPARRRLSRRRPGLSGAEFREGPRLPAQLRARAQSCHVRLPPNS